jgi:hypothetical protein
MDTLATANKFQSLMVRDAEYLATRTDFTNKEQSVLQVVSYCFSGSQMSESKFAGVVKAVRIE